MTPKERAAMQQALEALEGISHGTDWNNGTHAKIYRPKFPAAITALREALGNSLKRKCFADYQPNHAIDRACASCPVAVECQTGEQAEQEPVAWRCNLCGIKTPHEHISSGVIKSITPVETEAQEPVGHLCEASFGRGQVFWFNKPADNTPLYAAPVRTKDLTDDEIMKINVDTASIVPTCDRQFHFARAVIQEFRRKNGIV